MAKRIFSLAAVCLLGFMLLTAVAAIIFIGGNRAAVSAIYNRQQ